MKIIKEKNKHPFSLGVNVGLSGHIHTEGSVTVMQYFDWGWKVGCKPSRENMVVEYHSNPQIVTNGAITLTETSTHKVVSVQYEHSAQYHCIR